MKKNKYSIQITDDFNAWDEFVDNSRNGTIFSTHGYLKHAYNRFHLYFVYKGSNLRAAFPVLLSRCGHHVVCDDLVIYGGIMFVQPNDKKESRSRSERFEITSFIISWLDDNFSSLSFSFSPAFEDFRPFQWHNYHSSDLSNKFRIDLRYTSIINMYEESNYDNFESSPMFKCMDTLRKRNIREAFKDNASVVIDNSLASLFLDFYQSNMSAQGSCQDSNKLNRMKKIINYIIDSGSGAVLSTMNGAGDIIYITVFVWDNKRAYYLFGAPSPYSNERYQGTISFWYAINYLSKINHVELDLEGVNSPNRGAFKLGLGGSLAPYFNVFLKKTSYSNQF